MITPISSANGNKFISTHSLKRIKEIIFKLSEGTEEYDDIYTVSSVETVLFENYALCMAIANATSLLLNTPKFNVNIRRVLGSEHVWNVVTVKGMNYYIDNTKLITRNPHPIPNVLKVMKYDVEYLFF